MIISITSDKNLTFDEFLQYDVPEEGRYELVDGEIVRIQATRQHDNVADYVEEVFRAEVRRSTLNYRVSNRIGIRTETQSGREQSRHPDVSVVKKSLWDANLAAYTAFREPLQLAVEVVSTNWEDDYVDKLDEYQRLRMVEYWIVDYLGLGSRDYLGNPKEPVVLVFILNESGQYESTRFRGAEHIVSRTFPELNLTVAQILAA